MAAATKGALLQDLHEGDFFFYTSPEDYESREKRVLAINEFRASVGEKPFDPFEASQLIQATASAYRVLTTVIATGERVTIRLSDDKKHIWYDGFIPVRHALNREAFEIRMAEMRAARKRMEDEESRAQRPRHKKHNSPDELATRTLVANR